MTGVLSARGVFHISALVLLVTQVVVTCTCCMMHMGCLLPAATCIILMLHTYGAARERVILYLSACVLGATAGGHPRGV
jgi:hypothetical protein